MYLNNSKNIQRSYQRDFYNFLKEMLTSFMVNGLPLPFNADELTDPRTYKKIKEADTSIYSLAEYHALYEYTNQVDYHKERAIKSVKKLLKTMNINKYNRYDSYWLYIIIQLTNNWRHSTVITQIPRIDLSDTQIKSLDWLMDNNPSLEDANSIIFKIGRYVTNINKTGVSAEGIFTIGEPLKIAFATAISICELRTQGFCDNSATLIELSGSLKPRYNPHKGFFKNFNDGFKFENRKMNRTLTTLIWSVLRHMGKGLKESQFSRSHLQDSTTILHYIKLSDQQVEQLVIELFERNQFGFVTQLLSNILYGIEKDRHVETERMLGISEHFGDVIKIEATAGLLNRLSNEKEQVINYLKELNINEIQNIYNQAIVGVLPSKQRYYQCIYSYCKYESKDDVRTCENCSASIINVYALTNIMDNYILSMERIIREFDNATSGEKRKLANHFYLLHNVIQEAREKFGREVVDGFVKGKTNQIKHLGTQLTSKNLKNYRTMGVIKEDEQSG